MIYQCDVHGFGDVTIVKKIKPHSLAVVAQDAALEAYKKMDKSRNRWIVEVEGECYVAELNSNSLVRVEKI